MDKTINTNTNKVEYYEYSCAALDIKNEVLNVLENEIMTVNSVDRIVRLLSAARVMLISYDIERANFMSEVKAREEAEKAKAAEQLEKFSEEVFGA